jgi:hypothetical protein
VDCAAKLFEKQILPAPEYNMTTSEISIILVLSTCNKKMVHPKINNIGFEMIYGYSVG